MERDHAGARPRREGRCPRAKGDGKRVGVEATREMIARGDRNGEGEKRSASRERASERGYNRGCWTRAGRVVAVAAVVGDDREIPWIRPHEEKKAAALLRGRIDRERESAGESEVEIAGGELNVCKLNVLRLYLAQDFKGARGKRLARLYPGGILSNKVLAREYLISPRRERGGCRIRSLFSENRDYKFREVFVLDALCI